MKMVFLIPCSVYFWIFLSARARLIIFCSSSRSAVPTVRVVRSLPLTWITTVTVLEARYLSSQVGHSSLAPRCSSISLARCGAKGLSNLARATRSS